MSSYGAYLLQTLLLLVAVSALAVVVLFSAKKLGIGRPDGPIELVGRLPLDARRAVYLVKVGAEVLVVGASEAGLTKLGEMPAASLPPRADPATAKSFGDALAKVLARHRTKGDGTS
jgi:flagellar protein FliO/FliZ